MNGCLGYLICTDQKAFIKTFQIKKILFIIHLQPGIYNNFTVMCKNFMADFHEIEHLKTQSLLENRH